MSGWIRPTLGSTDHESGCNGWRGDERQEEAPCHIVRGSGTQAIAQFDRCHRRTGESKQCRDARRLRARRQSELDLWIVGSEDIAFQPIAELLHEVLAVFCWSTAVVQNADRIVTNLTRNHVWFVLGPVEDLEVVVTGELRVIRELLLA